MILERSMNDQFLSNTYLVADQEGGTAVLIDAGGPVGPLLDAIDAHGLTLSHVLLTHHHYDHVSELDAVLERHPGTPVLIHEGEREHVPQATGTIAPGETLEIGGLRIEGDVQGVSQVPLLGDIPIVGEAFKSRSNTRTRSW